LTLKEWYAQPGDHLEVPLDNFVIDIVRDDLLIEIQTGNFSSVKRKVTALTYRHPVRLVYPIASQKWIIKLSRDGSPLGRRKSPKRGRVEELFRELVRFPDLILEGNFSLEVVLIHEEELRRHDERRRWRRGGWVTVERRLLEILESRLFETPGDISALLPEKLPQRFTTLDLAEALNGPRRLAQKMAYCLREMGEIVPVGKQNRSILYMRAATSN
jgi:hypothetical protein